MTVDESDIKADMFRAIQAWFDCPAAVRPSAFALGDRIRILALPACAGTTRTGNVLPDMGPDWTPNNPHIAAIFSKPESAKSAAAPSAFFAGTFMSFHPDQNLPGCMMPDGGDCCAGHAAVCNDWHRQRQEIKWLRATLTHMAEARQSEITSRLRQIARDTLSVSSHHSSRGPDA